MDLLKAMGFGALITCCIAVVVGTQGSSGGALAIHALDIADYKVYWSWPMFLGGTGLFWALLIIQR